VPRFLPLGCIGAIALTVIAGYLIVNRPVPDPAPHPNLADVTPLAVPFVYPGSKQVGATILDRQCTRQDFTDSVGGCSGPYLDRSYTVTPPHQVVDWFSSTATAHGWQFWPVDADGFIDPNQGPNPSIGPDPRSEMCSYSKDALTVLLTTCFSTSNYLRTDWSDWDTVETVRFEVRMDRSS
jgi:hypothetical protein